jgi:hypothetical protein
MSEYWRKISQQREMQLLEQISKDQETITRLQKTVDVADVIQNSVQEQIKIKVGKLPRMASPGICFSSFLFRDDGSRVLACGFLTFSSHVIEVMLHGALPAKHDACAPLAHTPKNDEYMQMHLYKDIYSTRHMHLRKYQSPPFSPIRSTS